VHKILYRDSIMALKVVYPYWKESTLQLL